MFDGELKFFSNKITKDRNTEFKNILMNIFDMLNNAMIIWAYNLYLQQGTKC